MATYKFTTILSSTRNSGYYQLVGFNNLNQIAFSNGYAYSSGTLIPVPGPSPTFNTMNIAINNSGEILAYDYGVQSNDPVFTTYIGGNAPTHQDFPLPAGAPTPPNGYGNFIYAYALNDIGSIVGNYSDQGGDFPFLQAAGAVTLLTNPFINTSTYGAQTSPAAINNANTIVGSYYTAAGSQSHGFIYNNTNHSWATLDNPGAGLNGSTYLKYVTNSGKIVGYYYTGSTWSGYFLYDGGQFVSINDPLAAAGTTSVVGINNSGAIAGNYTDLSGHKHGYLYSNGVYTTVDAPLAGAGGTHLDGINDAGVLVGIYYASNGTPYYFTATAHSFATADLAGEGTSDILWRNGAGVSYLWTMNGAAVSASGPTSIQVGTNWQIKGVADFNGDGHADILWAYTNAANASDVLNGISYISLQNGSSAIGGGVVQQLASQWQVAGVGDFNGDGLADVLYRDTATGQVYLDIMNGAAVNWASSGFTSQQVTDAKWQIAAVADFNGDGAADVLWRYSNAANAADPLNGTLYEWQMNGATVTNASVLSQQAGGNWTVAGTGDFNGDGAADILFRYENLADPVDALNGLTYIDFMSGANVLATSAPTLWQVDNSWQVASIGDYNGDGMSDILWQRTSTGDAYIWQMNGAGVTSGAYTSSQSGTGWTVQNGALIA